MLSEGTSIEVLIIYRYGAVCLQVLLVLCRLNVKNVILLSKLFAALPSFYQINP